MKKNALPLDGSSGGRLAALTRRTEFTLGLIIIAMFLLASFLTPNFTSAYNLTNLFKQGAILGVLAVAQTLIIITGGIDISGGAIAGLGCMAMALLQTKTQIHYYTSILAILILQIMFLKDNHIFKVQNHKKGNYEWKQRNERIV